MKFCTTTHLNFAALSAEICAWKIAWEYMSAVKMHRNRLAAELCLIALPKKPRSWILV